jgi:hypothetical protein
MPNQDLGFDFDATQVDPRETFDPVPGGWYVARITGSEIKQAKSDPNNGYAELILTIVEPVPQARSGPDPALLVKSPVGRTVYDRLNIWNSNATAAEIAQRSLSQICHAVGVFQVRNTSVLHGIPLEVKLSVRPAHDGYDASNEVKGYRKVGGESQSVPQMGAPPAPAGQPQPWAAPPTSFEQPSAGGGAPAWPPQPPAGAPGAAPTFTPPPFQGGAPAGATGGPPQPPAGGGVAPPWAR